MYLNKIEKALSNNSDYTKRNIIINNNTINIICLETISSSDDINNYILKKMSNLEKLNTNDLFEYLFNYLPAMSINELTNDNDILNDILSGFTVIIINSNKVLSVETRKNLSRGVNEADYERTIKGPKDSFNEHFNTNIGLIRRRIKSSDLVIDTINIGRYTKTKTGLLYINSIAKKDLINKVKKKLNKINIDGIIDSSYLKSFLIKKNSIFPSIKETERPDLASQSLLEGKILIVCDNSPNILILPIFFIDYFHNSDDYYQLPLNITFIRFIRLIAFIIAIILPSYYVAVTTHNIDSIPSNLLINFVSQRQSVPFPAFLEAIIMIISFEILRESDMRIPSSMGTAVSILGGLVLGDAAVTAGIVSPIMIIVIALSAISGLLFQPIELINAIRWWRLIFIILAAFLGIYGIFIGTILFMIAITTDKEFNNNFLFPYAPINLSEQKTDGIIKKDEKTKYRNPLLSKNKIRGYK